MKRLVMIACAAVWLSGPAAVAALEAPVGSIRTLKGSAAIVRDERPLTTRIGDPVFAGDSLKTGKDGALSVVFKDDTLLSLGPESHLVVRFFAFSPAEGKLSFAAQMLKGTFAYLSGIIAKLSPEAVRIETPVAAIGIRGTHFAVAVAEAAGSAR